LSSNRSKIAVKNIGLSFVARALTVICSILQVPAALAILNKTEYGIWLTMYSVFGWFLVFDLGIGNGLKNKLTTALAVGDNALAKKYVSTAYVSVGVLTLLLTTVFLILFPFVNWIAFFNAPEFSESRFAWVVLLCCVCTLFSFLTGLIHAVLSSYQKIGLSNIIVFVPQLLLLLTMYAFRHFHIDNFFLIISVFVGLPLFVNLLYSFYAFHKPYKAISPTYRSYDRLFLKDIMGLGLRFFAVQVSGLIIFSTDNIFISHLYSPEKVTEYNIVVKYFSVLAIVFAVITGPLLALYTDAFAKNDYAWVKNQVSRLVRLWYVFIGIACFMVFVSPVIFHWWIDPSFDVPLLLVVFIGLYTIQGIWNVIFVVPSNSMGKIKLQVIYSAAAAIINVPLILLFHKYFGSINSIVVANIISLSIGSILAYMQYRRTITKVDRGIFTK